MRRTIMAAGAAVLAACGMPVVTPAPDVPAPIGVQAAPVPAQLAGEGRYAEAIALLEERARRQPGAAQLGDLGYAYYLGGRLAEARASLERACLAQPSSALAWERLAALLEATGDSGRALQAMRQARMLREAQAGAPQAAAGEARSARTMANAASATHARDATDATDAANTANTADAVSGGEPAAGLWPAGMARVEVRQVGAGLVEVRRTPAAAPLAAAPPGTPLRLEVSNGNGVRGMAAAVARQLAAQGMRVMRLTNTIPFNVEETRVEVRGRGEPQLRIVLGKDAGIKKPPGFSRRQAP